MWIVTGEDIAVTMWIVVGGIALVYVLLPETDSGYYVDCYRRDVAVSVWIVTGETAVSMWIVTGET